MSCGWVRVRVRVMHSSQLDDNNKSPKRWVVFLNTAHIELGLGLVLNQGDTEGWD